MKLKTKKGLLTRYALACGYVERKNNTNLFAINGGVLMVTKYNGGCFYTGRNLTEARKAFFKTARKILN